MLATFNERPGEFARRFDLAIRVAGDDNAATDRVVESFVRGVPSFATPVLLMLRSHLPARQNGPPLRVYWPKGRIAKGVTSPDERAGTALARDRTRGLWRSMQSFFAASQRNRPSRDVSSTRNCAHPCAV